MLFTLPLKEMSLHEKLMAIETIWDDISHSAAKLPSPDWHEDVLKERERNIKSGSDKLINWDEAKQELRSRTK